MFTIYISRQLLFNMSEATSYEIRAHWNRNSAKGNYSTYFGLGCFSPVVNIMRDPLWGRNQVNLLMYDLWLV